MRDVNGWIYCQVIFFRVIITLFNTGLPILGLFHFSVSPVFTPTCVLNSFTVALAWCQHIISYLMGNRWSCRKNSHWLSRRLNLSEKGCRYSPPALFFFFKLPGVELVCLSNKGQSQGASGAELCESLLKRSRWWISFTAAWSSSMSWEAHVWRTVKAH